MKIDSVVGHNTEDKQKKKINLKITKLLHVFLKQ